jgi:hypothetical protein
MDGTLTAVHVVHEHVVLRNSPCELEVRIRDRAGGIGAAHDVALHVGGKRRSPEQGVDLACPLVRDKDDSPHARGCGIRCSDRCDWCVYQLSESRGTVL